MFFLHYFDLLDCNTEGNKQAALLIVFFFRHSCAPLTKCHCKQELPESRDRGDQNNLTPLSNFPLAAQNGCLVNNWVMRSNRAGAENETLRA